jgi:glycosyltransferase involved in cell wall biosynthesis
VSGEKKDNIMEYKVSVIIATYNTGKYIEECLDSVFSQTLNEMEVIVIDDGSTDNTKQILEKYINNSNLVYRYQENKGVGPARNYGIDISTGDYLIFMDPDDKYPVNDCIEKLYNTAINNNVNICGGNILYNDRGIIRKCYNAGNGDANHSKNTIIKINEYYYIYDMRVKTSIKKIDCTLKISHKFMIVKNGIYF